MELGQIKTTKKSGSEPLHLDGKNTSHNLLSFWRWSSSEILGNGLRGVLAEYIVSIDINCPHETREEWDAFDLLTPENVKVEVKSASYLQSWEQKKYSSISFGIQPTVVWEANNARSKEAKRQADIYVFCLLSHKDQKTIDPLNLAQWEFYVLPTAILNEKCNQQKTITFSSLLKLEPIKCKFGEISGAIKSISS